MFNKWLIAYTVQQQAHFCKPEKTKIAKDFFSNQPRTCFIDERKKSLHQIKKPEIHRSL